MPFVLALYNTNDLSVVDTLLNILKLVILKLLKFTCMIS